MPLWLDITGIVISVNRFAVMAPAVTTLSTPSITQCQNAGRYVKQPEGGSMEM